MKYIIKYNKEKLNNSTMKQINFANLFNDILLKKTWNEEEKIALKEIVKRVKSLLEKNLYARKFLKDVNAYFLQNEKENFTKEDIEEIIHHNPDGISDILFENLLNRKTNIYGENGIYWLQKIMKRNQENYKFEAGIKEKHLIIYYEKTKYIQDEPIWKHLYNILKLKNYDDNITQYKHFFEVITKENKEDLLKQDKFGNNILTILLKNNHNKLKITSKDFSDTCDYIIKEYGIDEFKKLINNKNHTSLMPEYKYKNHILLNILNQSLTQERKEVLISYLDKDIINSLNQEQIERALNGNNISIKSINYILETRKEKEDVILEILVKKYRKEISKDILKDQYKKEIKYNNIENLLNTTLTNVFIRDSFFKEENIALVEKIRDVQDIKKKREYIKNITNKKGCSLEHTLKIIEILKEEKQESPYENYFIFFIMQQSEKEQEVVAREIIKDNKSISLVVRLLVLQKYKEVNLSKETQEIIVNRILDVNQNKILIDILFEDLYNKKQTQSNYGNISINKELTEKVINSYIEEKDTSINGLLAIIVNEKSIKDFQLNKELQLKIKENLEKNIIENKFFNKLEKENKKDKEKIKSMFKVIYVDGFYVNKEDKIKILEKINNEQILEKINGSWAKRIWHEEVIADVVNYSVNNKEMLTELLKTNNVIKEMVMEDLFEKAIEHKYWINKIGENTVKEVITYIATEYKSRNKLEEIMFSTIVKENKNNNKKDLFIQERDNSNSHAYFDLMNIGINNKELNKTISDKFQIFAEVLIKNIVECINKNQLEEKIIKVVLGRYITLKITQDNMQELEETYLRLNDKYKNNIDIVNKIIGQINPVKIWEHIGDEIKEKFDLSENNIIKKLEKYNEENTEGIFGYISKIKKEKIQKEIDNMYQINEMERWSIKKWINKGNSVKKYLNEEEKKQLNEVQEEVSKIGQLDVKNLSSYAKQELKKLSEQLIEDIGKEEFFKKSNDLKEKIQSAEKEVKENIKMEIKKEMAIIRYKT